jgi:hypothetical protein
VGFVVGLQVIGALEQLGSLAVNAIGYSAGTAHGISVSDGFSLTTDLNTNAQSDQMSDVVNTVVPVFALILLGFGAGKLGWFGEGSARGLSTFVFSFAIPAMLFKAMATFGLPASPPWALWGAFFGASLRSLALAVLLSRHVPGLGGAGGAPAALGAGFGNTVMLGLAPGGGTLW